MKKILFFILKKKFKIIFYKNNLGEKKEVDEGEEEIIILTNFN